tara:strand:- start:368 stop:541 length:174 start_codon:yes stop_codon:yes gene_type:complete
MASDLYLAEIGQIALTVRDVDVSAEFYLQKLGMRRRPGPAIRGIRVREPESAAPPST